MLDPARTLRPGAPDVIPGITANLLRSSSHLGSQLKEFTMASVCEVCGKGPRFGMSLSHSHRRTKRRWNPNIQRVRAIVKGSPRRVNACTACIKSGKVVKP